MVHSEYELKRQLYGAWKYAEGCANSGTGCAPIAAAFAAYAAWLKWDFWLWSVLAFFLIYKVCTNGQQKEVDEAFYRYESYLPFSNSDYRPSLEHMDDEIELK